MQPILPETLFWAPEHTQAQVGAAPVRVLRVSDYRLDENLRGGGYQVQHYPAKAVGMAFGPLALDQTLAFCRLLDDQLRQFPSVAVATEPGNVGERANTAVLLGAFLIFCKQWTPEQVAKALPTEASVAFPCSWAGRQAGWDKEPPVMSVQHCWEGLRLALDRGWVTADHLADDFATSLICSQYRRTVHEYDVVWLAPFEVAIAADPMTVIRDPNPLTCSALIPEAQAEAEEEEEESEGELVDTLGSTGSYLRSLTESTAESPNKQLCNEKGGKSFGKIKELEMAGMEVGAGVTNVNGKLDTSSGEAPVSNVKSGRPSTLWASDGSSDTFIDRAEECQPGSAAVPECAGAGASGTSAHTICKEYGPGQAETSGHQHKPQDFMTWCLSHNVGVMVRVNFCDETGLKEIGGSYPKETVERYGISHVSVPVNDHRGGTPDAASISAMLEQCGVVAEGKSVLFHCKGGFGRSAVMACCYLIRRHDLPGRALLGWLRIARPGAITTPEQERFLCQLRGAADLERHLRQQATRCTCSVS